MLTIELFCCLDKPLHSTALEEDLNVPEEEEEEQVNKGKARQKDTAEKKKRSTGRKVKARWGQRTVFTTVTVITDTILLCECELHESKNKAISDYSGSL